VTTIAEFSDPRLVAIYDTVNPYAVDAQPGFYSKLAAEYGSAKVIDLGCGTGQISRDLARQSHRVTGVDPSAEMLAVARQAPHGDQVTWIEGDSTALEIADFDLAIMTGHVAQFLLTPQDWHNALSVLRAALQPYGRIGFESRNPKAKEWERWTPENRRTFEDPVAGTIEHWSDVQDVRDGLVSYTNHYLFTATGEELTSSAQLRFRSEEDLTESLGDAGWYVQDIFGDWDGSPAGKKSPEIIIVATR